MSDNMIALRGLKDSIHMPLYLLVLQRQASTPHSATPETIQAPQLQF